MNKEITNKPSKSERRPAVMVVDECHQENSSSIDASNFPLNTLRQKLRERVAELLRVRSAGTIRNPNALTNAATTIESLLFRSINGRDGEHYYLELLQNQDAIQATLKELGTEILLRKLQKKQSKLGFRSKMVLKGMTTTGTKTKSDVEGFSVLLEASHILSTRKDEGTSGR